MKIIKLNNGQEIHLHFANNRGRGDNNCTLTLVKSGTIRQQYTRQYKTFLAQTRTSAWKGQPNLSKKILAEINVTKNMFCNYRI